MKEAKKHFQLGEEVAADSLMLLLAEFLETRIGAQRSIIRIRTNTA
jgi:hypothetical protein